MSTTVKNTPASIAAFQYGTMTCRYLCGSAKFTNRSTAMLAAAIVKPAHTEMNHVMNTTGIRYMAEKTNSVPLTTFMAVITANRAIPAVTTKILGWRLTNSEISIRRDGVLVVCISR